jgi:hypothetical protein
MTKPVVYYWASTQGNGYINGIALNQSANQNNNLVLVSNTPSGAFSYINMLIPQTSMSEVSTDVLRTINFTSTTATSNAGVTFVINGIGSPVDGNGNPTGIVGPITENKTGPGGNATVTSVNVYSTINSITVTNANANNIEVGFGPNGITNYYTLDCNRTSIQGYSSSFSLQFIPTPAVNIQAGIYVSLNQPQMPTIYGGVQPFGLINGTQVAFIPDFQYQAPTNATSFSYIYTGFQLIWSTITSNQALTADQMFFTIFQQGI